MVPFIAGESLEAVVKRLSQYEHTRQYSPVRPPSTGASATQHRPWSVVAER
jgi:hypothetical protein